MRGTADESLVKELSTRRANAVKEALVNKFKMQPNQFSVSRLWLGPARRSEGPGQPRQEPARRGQGRAGGGAVARPVATDNPKPPTGGDGAPASEAPAAPGGAAPAAPVAPRAAPAAPVAPTAAPVAPPAAPVASAAPAPATSAEARAQEVKQELQAEAARLAGRAAPVAAAKPADAKPADAKPAPAADVLPTPPPWWRTLRADPPAHIRTIARRRPDRAAAAAVVPGHPRRSDERIISPSKLPSPGEVFGSFGRAAGSRARPTASIDTLERVFKGIGLAAFVGIAVGVLAAANRGVGAALAPLVIFLRSVPMGALIPLTLMLFGDGEKQKWMFIFLAVVPFVFSDTVKAISIVPERYVETAQTLGASRLQIIRKVLVPLALPDIITSLRFLLGLALGYIMLVEAINAPRGLGTLLITQRAAGPVRARLPAAVRDRADRVHARSPPPRPCSAACSRGGRIYERRRAQAPTRHRHRARWRRGDRRRRRPRAIPRPRPPRSPRSRPTSRSWPCATSPPSAPPPTWRGPPRRTAPPSSPRRRPPSPPRRRPLGPPWRRRPRSPAGRRPRAGARHAAREAAGRAFDKVTKTYGSGPARSPRSRTSRSRSPTTRAAASSCRSSGPRAAASRR